MISRQTHKVAPYPADRGAVPPTVNSCLVLHDRLVDLLRSSIGLLRWSQSYAGPNQLAACTELARRDEEGTYLVILLPASDCHEI